MIILTTPGKSFLLDIISLPSVSKEKNSRQPNVCITWTMSFPSWKCFCLGSRGRRVGLKGKEAIFSTRLLFWEIHPFLDVNDYRDFQPQFYIRNVHITGKVKRFKFWRRKLSKFGTKFWGRAVCFLPSTCAAVIFQELQKAQAVKQGCALNGDLGKRTHINTDLHVCIYSEVSRPSFHVCLKPKSTKI